MEVQQQIGGWLGWFIHMPVESAAVLTVDECKYVAFALQHTKLYNQVPCTESQYDELCATNVSLLEAKLAIAEG